MPYFGDIGIFDFILLAVCLFLKILQTQAQQHMQNTGQHITMAKPRARAIKNKM
jgi:hypothetical protein